MCARIVPPYQHVQGWVGHGLGTSHALQLLSNAVPRLSPRFCIPDCGVPMANPVVGAIPTRPTVYRHRAGPSRYHDGGTDSKGLFLVDITCVSLDERTNHEPEIHGSFERALVVFVC